MRTFSPLTTHNLSLCSDSSGKTQAIYWRYNHCSLITTDHVCLWFQPVFAAPRQLQEMKHDSSWSLVQRLGLGGEIAAPQFYSQSSKPASSWAINLRAIAKSFFGQVVCQRTERIKRCLWLFGHCLGWSRKQRS